MWEVEHTSQHTELPSAACGAQCGVAGQSCPSSSRPSALAAPQQRLRHTPSRLVALAHGPRYPIVLSLAKKLPDRLTQSQVAASRGPFLYSTNTLGWLGRPPD